jgi:hypothetical protein
MLDRVGGTFLGFALSYLFHFGLPIPVILVIVFGGCYMILAGEEKHATP